MTSLLLSITSAFLLMTAIWSLLKLRDWQYARHGWTIWKHENMIFLSSLILVLTIHSTLTGSDYTAILSTAPWAIVSVKIYETFRRKKQ